MDSVIGLIGLTVYMAAIIGLASAITWGVVKVSPSKSQKQLDAKKPSA